MTSLLERLGTELPGRVTAHNTFLWRCTSYNTSDSSKMEEVVYLMIEREFIESNQNVYKIGRTRFPSLKRFNAYPKKSKLLLHIYVDDSLSVETTIKNRFKELFKWRPDIGYEYFEGDRDEMIDELLSISRTTFKNKLKIMQTSSSNNSQMEQIVEHPISFAENITMDVCESHVSSRVLKCDCGFQCARKQNLVRHRQTEKHKLSMFLFEKDITPDANGNYVCSHCNYVTYHRANFRKHLMSLKHIDAKKEATRASSSSVMEKVVELFTKQTELMKMLR